MKRLLSHHITIAQWGQAPLLIYLPLYIALYGGYAEKLGLKPSLIFGGDDENISKTVQKGDADFGIGDPVFSEVGASKNRIYCPALLVKRVPIWGVTHNPTIPRLERVEDFVRLRIGSLPKKSTTYSLMEGLKANHKRLLKYMEIVEAPIDKQFKLLSEGRADVILAIEPYVSMAEYQGLKAVFSLAQFYGDFAFTGLIASKRFSDENPDIVKKLIKVLDKGLEICRKDKNKAAKIARQVFPDYPASVIEKGIHRLRANNIWPLKAAVDQGAWQAAIQLRKKIGHL